MRIKSIKSLAGRLAGKKVLLRVDYNVPGEKGIIKDDYKIKKQLPTLKFLAQNKAKIIILTHWGKPGGKIVREYSLKPIADLLSGLICQDVSLLKNCCAPKAEVIADQADKGRILMLENIRFCSGEERNSRSFAANLAKLADIYVNDAFAVSHRLHASVAAIKEYLPAYAGLLLAEEVENLSRAFRPAVAQAAIIGGVKLATKIPLIRNLAEKSRFVLLGGALANNFFAACGWETGKSLVERQGVKLADELLTENDNIKLPVDLIVSRTAAGEGVRARAVDEVKKDEYIFDIGPKTVRLYAGFIKRAGIIIWNGPMGVFENDYFKHGTLGVARLVAARSSGRAFGIVGGGETVEALKETKMMEYVDWVSTGGGAMLSYLGGKPMPGLAGIVA